MEEKQSAILLSLTSALAQVVHLLWWLSKGGLHRRRDLHSYKPATVLFHGVIVDYYWCLKSAWFRTPFFDSCKVLSGLKESNSDPDQKEHHELEDNGIPGGTKLLKKLQGSLSHGEEVFLAAAEAVKTAMSNLLMKKQNSSEKRKFRKRTRNDEKIKQ